MALPSNTEAEASVLAGVLLRNEAMADIVLAPEDFAHPGYRAVWRAMQSLHGRDQQIDPVTLEPLLDASGELGLVGGLEGLGKLADRYVSAAHVASHAEIVLRVTRRRRLVLACRDVAEEGAGAVEDEDTFLESAERRLMAAVERQGANPVQTSTDVIGRTISGMYERMKRKDEVIGIASGIGNLDRLIGGFQPAKLYVIAGRPGHGKSALACTIALAAATSMRRGITHPSLVANAEMPPEEVGERMVWGIIRRTERPLGLPARVRSGRITERDNEVIIVAAERIHHAPISFLNAAGMTAEEVCASARRWRRKLGDTDAVLVVDYLQLLRPPRGLNVHSREQEVAAISRSMKLLAMELRIPVLLLSQLNRKVDERSDHRPLLSDLRESGAIEQDADVVMFVYRPGEYIADKTSAEYRKIEDHAEIIVAKQRQGEKGLVRCRYAGPYMTFEEPDR